MRPDRSKRPTGCLSLKLKTMKKLIERIVFTLFVSAVIFAAMVVFALIENIAPIHNF